MPTHTETQAHEPVGEILARLTEGNHRFAAGEPRLSQVSPQIRSTLVCAQKPSVAILCCSDSRVSPELIFDQGLGDLFVVRVAGNVVDETVLSSLEYAVDHLAVALVFVLGHSGCDTVTSACSCDPDTLAGASDSILRAIGPAVKAARSGSSSSEELVDVTARLNVARQVETLLDSPRIRHSIAGRHLTVMGAWYNMVSGLVSWL